MVKTAMTQPKKLVIDRKRWLRGTGSGTGNLCNKKGKMCCLGFYAIECGHTVEDIRGIPDPAKMISSGVILRKGMERLMTDVTDDGRLLMNSTCTGLYGTNDDKGIDDSARESRITQHFKKIGVEVEFVGDGR